MKNGCFFGDLTVSTLSNRVDRPRVLPKDSYGPREKGRHTVERHRPHRVRASRDVSVGHLSLYLESVGHEGPPSLSRRWSRHKWSKVKEEKELVDLVR